MGYITKIDEDIAKFYAPMVLESIGFGERQINVWLPGAGKTTITKDIITNRKLVKETLGKITDRLIFVPISCEFISSHGIESVFEEICLDLKITSKNSDLTNYINKISSWCSDKIIKEDKEIVLVINNIDNLEEIELEKFLIAIFKIISSNKRKILSIININNPKIVDGKILSNPLLFTLINRIKYLPLLDKNLLNSYVDAKTFEYKKVLSDKEKKGLINQYGGILSLLKEAIRNYPDTTLVDLKIKSLLPNVDKNNLEKFNAQNLKVFDNLSIFNAENTEKILKNRLRGKYKILHLYLTKNKKQIISKDDMADIIWDQKNDEFASDWAINQVISRFRKKLIKFGVDPTRLETVNGKGYIWN